MFDWGAIFSPTVQAVTMILLATVVPSVRGMYKELRQLNNSFLLLQGKLEGHIMLDDARFSELRALIRVQENRE